MTLGLDLGGTTTDIVGFLDDKMIEPLTVRADDPVASASGALGKFLSTNNLDLRTIRTIALTGVGTGRIGKTLLGIPVKRIDEFTAIGLGGCYLSGKCEGIVVSMGTGTAIVDVKGKHIEHWGGTGLGGGTVIGLSKYLLRTVDIQRIVSKAKNGDLSKVDISIGDISTAEITGLPDDTTASNFGKAGDDASDNDLALAIINLVCQNIGVLAVCASRSTGNETIILTGKLSTIPPVKSICDNLSILYDKTFIIPEKAQFATAIGAAIAIES